jgi:guanine nucleotide-binding protein G(i) subunit alpha
VLNSKLLLFHNIVNEIELFVLFPFSYFDSIDRLLMKDYLPTDQDILRARVKTTGITEMKFNVGDLVYRMFDVGGQRSERKKWIHCFENVMAIIFLVAVSAYDQVLIEDESINRMEEALVLFNSICNSKWFVQTSIILFLNKIDIFKEKIKTSPVSKYFPDYNGGSNYDEAIKYFSNRFTSLNQSKEKKVYVYYTCGTDTGQLKFIMSAVKDIVTRQNLEQFGLF